MNYETIKIAVPPGDTYFEVPVGTPQEDIDEWVELFMRDKKLAEEPPGSQFAADEETQNDSAFDPATPWSHLKDGPPPGS